MKIQQVNLKEIISPEFNPRKITEEELTKLKNSIQEFGYVEPIIINEYNNHIIGGNQRAKALIELGYNTVDAVYVNLTDLNKEKALNIALNKISGEWDNNKLEVILQEIQLSEVEIGLTGFDDIELQDLNIIENEPPEIIGEEYTEEIENPLNIKEGDLYQLGNHRLLCGDCTDENNIKKLMGNNTCDLLFTDPPYKLETKGGHNCEIGNSLKKQGEDIEFISNFEPQKFLNIFPLLFKSNYINGYIFCNKELLPDYLNYAKKSDYSYNILIWKKPTAIPIADSHRPDIEYIVLLRKNSIWNNSLKNVNYSRCLEYNREQKNDENGNHPTIKPLELIVNELQISSNEQSIIVDLFGGSGSTLIACEQLNRNCYMMEIDPHYINVIIQRWETLTGQKAKFIKNIHEE